MSEPKRKQPKVYLFGHFAGGNFGNDSTFEAVLYHLRRLVPDVQVTCISTFPERVAAAYKIPAIPINQNLSTGWEPRNGVLKIVRKVFVGIPNEIYRWFSAFKRLGNADMLVVAGTGLLNDAYGLKAWGPYSIFRWSVVAKFRGCKVIFVSVGAGPLDSRLGRWFVKSALKLADFRSYRDRETKEYLALLGMGVAEDRVYPDLAFSIADGALQNSETARRAVGLGLMQYHGKLSSDEPNNSTYSQHLDQLVIFARWLLERGYDVRLITGDMADRSVIEEFKVLLKERLSVDDSQRVIDEPIDSFEALLNQLAQIDLVVATRFHNILWSLALNKPVIAIAFHQKCTSLMDDMGLAEYCQDIRHLNADQLMKQFLQLENHATEIRQVIPPRVSERRLALDEQYRLIFREFLLAGSSASSQ